MQLDDLTLSALADELNGRFSGGRIDKISMPRGDMLIFQVYAGGKNSRILACCGANARIHATENRYENPQEPPSACVFYRKRLQGGRIDRVFKTEGERIIGVEITSEDELGDARGYTFYCELIGRRQNLVLTDSDGVIIHCFKQFSPEVWPERPVLPGLIWKLPEQRAGVEVSEADLGRICREAAVSEDPGKALSNSLRQISPAVGRILFQRAQGEPSRLEKLIKTVEPEPWVNGESFSPVMPCGDGWERADSFSQALDTVYRSFEEESTRKNLASSVIKTVQNAKKKAVRRLANQQQEMLEAENREEVKKNADLIMANLWAIKPGAAEADVTDYWQQPPREVRIELDPQLSASDNAQLLYKRYGRLKRAAEALAVRIEIGRREIEYLDSVLYSLSKVSTSAEVDAVKEELSEAGYVKYGRNRKKVRALPARAPEISPSGFEIVWGRNNRENDELRRAADRNDLWFHAKDIPGSHVIMKTGGCEPAAEDIEFAAGLAAKHSSSTAGYRVAVDWCKVKNVKKTPDAGAGMVNYTSFSTVIVSV